MIITYSGARHVVDRLMAAPGIWYHLYTNVVALDEDTQLDDLVEADWPGYVPHHVHSWAPALTVEGRATTQADPQTWERGAGGEPSQTVGYYVTYGQAGALLWVEERTEGPIPMVLEGDTTVVYPQFQFRQIG